MKSNRQQRKHSSINREVNRFINLLKIRVNWVRIKYFQSRTDPKKLELVKTVASFSKHEFIDPSSGKTLKYNLFIPRNYDPRQSYPLVLFIHDAGVISKDLLTTLIQGLGAVIWAMPAEQAKQPCFVLAPQFLQVIVNDDSEHSHEIDVTVKLIRSLIDRYSIDENRLYTTGQSMGCMASIAMLIKYPGFFTASLLVAGQWDPQEMAVLINEKMWIVVSEGDQKAFPGMNASLDLLEANGAKVSRAFWNGQADRTEFSTLADKMIAEGSNINYTVFLKGTVVPPGLPDTGIQNHLHTWKIAYEIEPLRGWLFSQEKVKNKL